MEQFNIIGALESYAISKGWLFAYGFNDFYSNIATTQNFDNGENILIADFRSSPKYYAGTITSIRYTCLLMLGRKFDLSGQSVNLDETIKQKFDRRLKDLAQLLANSIADFSCVNELEIEAAPITVEINVFDTNLDFAISESAIFID